MITHVQAAPGWIGAAEILSENRRQRHGEGRAFRQGTRKKVQYF